MCVSPVPLRKSRNQNNLRIACKFRAEQYWLAKDEVESVLLDDDAQILPNRSHPEHCLVAGYTYTGRFIVVPFEIQDEKTPVIRPITAFEPSEDEED